MNHPIQTSTENILNIHYPVINIRKLTITVISSLIKNTRWHSQQKDWNRPRYNYFYSRDSTYLSYLFLFPFFLSLAAVHCNIVSPQYSVQGTINWTPSADWSYIISPRLPCSRPAESLAGLSCSTVWRSLAVNQESLCHRPSPTSRNTATTAPTPHSGRGYQTWRGTRNQTKIGRA